jgi:hypothetical protein
VETVAYDATGVTVGSYIAAPETAAEVRAIFAPAFSATGPIFATGEFIHKADANINMSLLTAPLSEDGVAADMTLSTLAVRFSTAAAPEPGSLKGLPVRVDRVLEVRDVAQLETLCRECGRSAAPHSEAPAIIAAPIARFERLTSGGWPSSCGRRFSSRRTLKLCSARRIARITAIDGPALGYSLSR